MLAVEVAEELAAAALAAAAAAPPSTAATTEVSQAPRVLALFRVLRSKTTHPANCIELQGRILGPPSTGCGLEEVVTVESCSEFSLMSHDPVCLYEPRSTNVSVCWYGGGTIWQQTGRIHKKCQVGPNCSGIGTDGSSRAHSNQNYSVQIPCGFVAERGESIMSVGEGPCECVCVCVRFATEVNFTEMGATPTVVRVPSLCGWSWCSQHCKPEWRCGL